MSSTRSIAAARARRANEPAPPISGTRPGTSIGSHAAFVQQQAPPSYSKQQPPPQYLKQQPQQPQQQFQGQNNVRLSKTQIQSQMQSQIQPQIQQTNSLPFSKLSISDAIGLITLRLGRVEQFLIDNEFEKNNSNSSIDNSIPENYKVIDNSVLTSIINRIDTVEKTKILSNNSSEETFKISEEFIKNTENINFINNELNNQKSSIFKNSEKISIINKDVLKIKDMISSLTLQFNSFLLQTNEKFTDHEFAICEIEKNIIPINIHNHLENNNDIHNYLDNNNNNDLLNQLDNNNNELQTHLDNNTEINNIYQFNNNSSEQIDSNSDIINDNDDNDENNVIEEISEETESDENKTNMTFDLKNIIKKEFLSNKT